MDTPEEFWAMVRVGAPDACWPWLGGTGGKGRHRYGRVVWRGKIRQATHVALELTGSVLRPGNLVRHSCDTSLCCNGYRHLVLGTTQQNVNDRVSRNRSSRGESRPCHRLSEAEVRSIREEGKLRRHGAQVAMAQRYGVSRETIRLILKGKAWSSVV